MTHNIMTTALYKLDIKNYVGLRFFSSLFFSFSFFFLLYEANAIVSV